MVGKKEKHCGVITVGVGRMNDREITADYYGL